MPDMSDQPVIFFDGVCNLCNAAVQFVIEHDKKNIFKFTALQGKYAEDVLPQFRVNLAEVDSILLADNNKLYTKSSAALRVAKNLNGLLPLLYMLMIVPKFIRDWFYDIIAKNRYKWWGRQETCWVPTPALAQKFYP